MRRHHKKKSPLKKEQKRAFPYQKALFNMEKKLSKSFSKLSKDMRKNANLKILNNDTNELMMLLGETQYLTKECKRMRKK
jgi:hypothetical protein